MKFVLFFFNISFLLLLCFDDSYCLEIKGGKFSIEVPIICL